MVFFHLSLSSKEWVRKFKDRFYFCGDTDIAEAAVPVISHTVRLSVLNLTPTLQPGLIPVFHFNNRKNVVFYRVMCISKYI